MPVCPLSQSSEFFFLDCKGYLYIFYRYLPILYRVFMLHFNSYRLVLYNDYIIILFIRIRRFVSESKKDQNRCS